MRAKIAVLLTATSAVLFLSGCTVENLQSQVKNLLTGNWQSIKQNQNLNSQAENYNPVFDSEEGIEAQTMVAKDVDGVAKKALTDVFGDAKLISGGNTDSTPFLLNYIVKRRIDQVDGDALYKEFLSLECTPKADGNPKLDSSRNTVEMTVVRYVGGRGYNLNVVIDLAEQSIWINVS